MFGRFEGAVALAVAIAAVGCAREAAKSQTGSVEGRMELGEQATPFGYKCAWLAVKTTDPGSLIQRLGIGDARQTAWSEGIDAAYRRDADRLVYVTPVVDGWVLVVGTYLFQVPGIRREDELRLPEYVTSLSQSLGTVVQYFATHRVSEAHTWILADGGRLVRAYGVGDGAATFDRGEQTPAEKQLEINFDLMAGGPPISKENKAEWRKRYEEWAGHQVNEEMVMKVAARWSVDPLTLGERRLPPGWLGVYARAN